MRGDFSGKVIKVLVPQLKEEVLLPQNAATFQLGQCGSEEPFVQVGVQIMWVEGPEAIRVFAEKFEQIILVGERFVQVVTRTF